MFARKNMQACFMFPAYCIVELIHVFVLPGIFCSKCSPARRFMGQWQELYVWEPILSLVGGRDDRREENMLRKEDFEEMDQERLYGGQIKEKSAGCSLPDSSVVMQQEETEPVPAQNEQYQNFIVRYNQNIYGELEYESDKTFQIINDRFGILYVPAGQVTKLEFTSYTYSSIPKCYTYMDLGGLAASGVTKLHDHPYLKLRGAGTMIAVIDSGIDYQHPAFRNGNQSRIINIWDQSLPGGESETAPFGQVFSREEINRALESENPLELVPSVDTNGHGTRLAATAAGKYIPEEGFSGAAPEAELVIIKLKPAKQYLRDFYLISPEAEVFQEDDIMLGISYAMKCALRYQMPLSICIGLGSSQGSHRGESPLCQLIDSTANFSQNAVSAAAGNEGLSRHHYMGTIDEAESSDVIELRVGGPETDQGFSMEFWGDSPNFYSVSILSPTGERLAVSTALKYGTQELSFVFVETKIQVNYIPIERNSGNTLIFFRFLHPAAGIWKLEVEGRRNGASRFHLWLPVQGMISPETYFLEPSPEYTITSPGDAEDGMTATAYQQRDGSLYTRASRGYTTDHLVKPDFAAPGVDVKTASAGIAGGFGEASGTSLAAAQTAGIAALMFEWAIIRGNEPYFSGNSVKNYLRRGAVREEDMQYPNQEWGYGKVDLYHTFELLT